MNKLQHKEIIQGLPPTLLESDVCSIDLELSGLKEGQLHRPFGHMVSLACSFDGETAYIIFEEDEVQEFLDRIDKATWIFHNSVFDVGHLRRWANIPERKNMRDIMIIERNMFSNYYEDFSLSDLVRRYLKCYMEKETRKEFHDLDTTMTQSQIEYAALDVIGTWLADKEQQKLVEPRDALLWDTMYNPHVWTTLELGGFKLDVDCWRDLADEQQLIVDELSDVLGKKYGRVETKLVGRGKNRHEEGSFVPFNLNSPYQVKEILKKQGIIVDSTDDDHIRPFYETNEFVNNILDFRKAEKQVSTYGLSFLKNVEDDNRIFTSLNISQAETGRDSSSSPNLQNIPKEKRRRRCFIAGDGRKLVLYDYSGQEINLFAFITQDPILIEIINSGKKPYIEIARMAFDEIIVKDSLRYDVVKALVLGLMYGLTPYGFARDNDVSQEVAESMYKKVFEVLPVSAKWIKEQQSYNRGITKTILGRKCHLHPYDRQWKNNALNNPMQGSGADMIKLAMKRLRKTEFYKLHHPTGKLNIVLQIHDEIVVDVDEKLAIEWGGIQRNTMIEVAESIHPGIRGGVSGGILDNWSQKDEK